MKKEFNRADWFLGQWARWSFIDGGGAAGYPSSTPFRKLLGGSLPSAMISDEEAQLIDTIVAQLRQHHPTIAKAIKTYYRNGCNVTKTAQMMETDRHKVDQYIKQGIMWVDAALIYCQSAA